MTCQLTLLLDYSVDQDLSSDELSYDFPFHHSLHLSRISEHDDDDDDDDKDGDDDHHYLHGVPVLLLLVKRIYLSCNEDGEMMVMMMKNGEIVMMMMNGEMMVMMTNERLL
jgi:hypothetical protein